MMDPHDRIREVLFGLQRLARGVEKFDIQRAYDRIEKVVELFSVFFIFTSYLVGAAHPGQSVSCPFSFS